MRIFECLSKASYNLTTLAEVVFKLKMRICDRKFPVFSLTLKRFPTLALILHLKNLFLLQVLNPFLYIRVLKLLPHKIRCLQRARQKAPLARNMAFLTEHKGATPSGSLRLWASGDEH